MFCRYCGAKIEDENRTDCPVCGAVLKEEAKTQQSDNNYDDFAARQNAFYQNASSANSNPNNNRNASPNDAYQNGSYGQNGYYQNFDAYEESRRRYEEEQKRKADESGAVGFGFLGFFIPIVGFILFLVWRSEYPKRSRASGIGCLVSVCLWIFIIILWTIIVGVAISSVAPYAAMLPLALILL